MFNRSLLQMATSYYIISVSLKINFNYSLIPSSFFFVLLVKSLSFRGKCLFNVVRTYLQLLLEGFLLNKVQLNHIKQFKR